MVEDHDPIPSEIHDGTESSVFLINPESLLGIRQDEPALLSPDIDHILVDDRSGFDRPLRQDKQADNHQSADKEVFSVHDCSLSNVHSRPFSRIGFSGREDYKIEHKNDK